VEVDPDRITQVLLNLAKNAVEASDPGGELRFRLTFGAVEDPLVDAFGEYAILQIEDEGVGMEPEEVEHIFEPFFSTKHEGTGLGLFVVHSIVERHGGAIRVKSELGKGSTFTVYLPVERVRDGAGG
jgi:two-component system sensor histidine kinase HydH